MPARSPNPDWSAVSSRARARAHVARRPVSASSCGACSMRRLAPVALLVVVVVTMSAAIGVARAQGTWSTAQLSVARGSHAAASVGSVALFAGGIGAGTAVCREWSWSSDGCLCVECLRVVHCIGSLCYAAACSLMCSTAGIYSNATDLYNSATGLWSTAQLSVARSSLAAASVGNVALFAGGLQNPAGALM